MILSSVVLYSLYKIAVYLYDVCSQYENFFGYLKVLPDEDYKPGCLEAGMWISRSMERGYINLQPLIYTQHHGIMINSNTVAHFQNNVIKLSSLKEYMGDEKIINVYKKRSNFEWTGEEPINWEGKYNLIYNNCEHFASAMIEGYPRSRQIEVLEFLIYHLIFGKGYPPESLKLIPMARYRYFTFNQNPIPFSHNVRDENEDSYISIQRTVELDNNPNVNTIEDNSQQ